MGCEHKEQCGAYRIHRLVSQAIKEIGGDEQGLEKLAKGIEGALEQIRSPKPLDFPFPVVKGKLVKP